MHVSHILPDIAAKIPVGGEITKRVFKHPLQGDGPGCCGAVHTGLRRDRPPSSVAPPDEGKTGRANVKFRVHYIRQPIGSSSI